ncbi:MAG: dihydrofolate reductase family protein [Nakamurella sp.]
MRELVYFVAVSLDGRIASPDGAFDAFPTSGDHFAMIIADWADTLPAPALAALGVEPDGSRFDTVLMGWNTYAVGLPGLTEPYPHLTQIVFSRTRTADDVGPSVRRTDRDPIDVVRELKSQHGGDIWLCGGGVLAAAQLPEIDRLVPKVNPVVLGDGKPLFDGAGYSPTDFALTHSTAYASGVVVGDYRRSRSR